MFAVAEAALCACPVNVAFHGARRHDEAFGDLRVGQALGDEVGDLAFAGAKRQRLARISAGVLIPPHEPSRDQIGALLSGADAAAQAAVLFDAAAGLGASHRRLISACCCAVVARWKAITATTAPTTALTAIMAVAAGTPYRVRERLRSVAACASAVS